MASGMNIQDDANCGWKVIIAEWAPLAISTIIMIARVFARTCVENDRVVFRKFSLSKLRSDDYLMLASTLVQYAHAITMTVTWHYGLGRHIWTLDNVIKSQTIEGIQVIKGLSIIPSMLGRVSIALYQLRLLPSTGPKWKRAVLLFVIILDSSVNGLTLIEIYTQCGSKVSALWDPAVAAVAKCTAPDIETNVGYAQSAVNSLCDLILSVFPIVLLWGVQMSMKKKVQLYAVLSTSYLALIASIIKTVRISNLNSSTDFTWNFVQLQIWVSIEVNTIIITGSFPSLYPILKLWFGPEPPSSSALSNSHGPTRYYGDGSRCSQMLRPGLAYSQGGQRSPMARRDSQELSILKIQDYHVNVSEDREKGEGESDGSQHSFTG